ncbi:MAG TPA: amidase [Flavilitoribacter sp.]|nr:amidase [Flavilitoribacter sp.]
MKKYFKPILLLLTVFFAGAFTGRWWESKITDYDVQAAAKIMDLDFTHAEVDSLIDGLEDFRNDYRDNRNKELANSDSPALVFRPFPAGFQPDQKQDPVVFTDPGQVKMPANKDDLAFYTVAQLGALLRSKKITSLELTEFFLARLKKFDPQLHCVITLTEDLAREQAKRADREIAQGKFRGPLHGIPYGAKDLLAQKDYKTTWGAMPYKDQMLDYDATVISKLDAAGAVLVAKLTMGALAWGDVWYGGMTRNPWDPSTGSSGSSAGSASSVSAGLLPFAIGTETLGSIVSPSTVCGVTGLRPTFGRVSRAGAMALCWSLDKIGPICRSAEDCAMVLQAIAGPDLKDQSVIDAAFNYQTNWKNNRKLKVGYLKTAFDRNYPFHSQDSTALQTLRDMGYELVPIELPNMGDIGFILDAEAAAAFDDLTRSGRDDLLVRQIKRAWPNVFRQARFIPAVEYIRANRLRAKLIENMAKVFDGIDLYVNPSFASASLAITNYTGHPSITVPDGFRDGKPTSITFTGKLFDEGTIVAVAQAFQERTDFEGRRPGGF